MLWASLRDLQWRRRRFAIAAAGTALVFALTLVLAGLANGFRSETRRAVAAEHADGWVVHTGVPGPFTSAPALSPSAVAAVAAVPGVRSAASILVVRQTMVRAHASDSFLLGVQPGGTGVPPIPEGRFAASPTEAVADRASHLHIGDHFAMAGRTLTVVGRTHGRTVLAGIPLVYMRFADAENLLFGDAPRVSAVLVRGRPASMPAGMTLLSNDQARADITRPLLQPIQAIDMVSQLLWLVAAALVGSVVYLSALERTRDFAVLKAVGTSSRTLYAGLAAQATLVAGLAAGLGAVLALGLAPNFPLPVDMPARAFMVLPVLAIVVGLLASAAGLRRAVGTDPAIAFGGP